MKRFKFRSMALLAVLTVLLASCTAMYETAGGYEEAPVRKRVYTNYPYSGNVIVVERDPFTGRYYEVSPYGSFAYPYGTFGYGYSVPPRGGYYRPAPARPAPVRPQPAPRQRGSETTNKAKDILKGNNR